MTLTITEKLPEVAGVAQTRTTTLSRCHFMLTSVAERRAAGGALPARSAFAMLPTHGYGEWWSVAAGDEIAHDGITYSVLSATPVKDMRGRLKHIEVDCG